MKDIKMIQTELLEKEIAVTEMKNILDGINRLDRLDRLDRLKD